MPGGTTCVTSMNVLAGSSVSGRTIKKALLTRRYAITVIKFWLEGKNAADSVFLVTDASMGITWGSIRETLWELNLRLYAELQVRLTCENVDSI